MAYQIGVIDLKLPKFDQVILLSGHVENTMSRGGMTMNSAIEKYNASQTEADQTICRLLMDAIDCTLITAESKIWHGSPVWFMDGNPIAGYSKQKSGIQLLFWSGASFEDSLQPVGKFKAAEVRYNDVDEIFASISDLAGVRIAAYQHQFSPALRQALGRLQPHA